MGPLVPEMIALLGGIMTAVILVMPLSTLLGFLGILVAPVAEESSGDGSFCFFYQTFGDGDIFSDYSGGIFGALIESFD